MNSARAARRASGLVNASRFNRALTVSWNRSSLPLEKVVNCAA